MRRWGKGRRAERILREHEAAVAEAAEKLSREIDERWAEFNRMLDEGGDHDRPWGKE